MVSSQVELTKRAQDLSALIAPNGQVSKWKVMPFGLTNAPAAFQELMTLDYCLKVKAVLLNSTLFNLSIEQN